MLADNVTCNRNLADLMQIPHIGCYSHRLNLWVKCYTEQYEPLLGAVNDLMLKLRTLKGAAALQKAYDDGEYKYVALHRNKTRWSSTFNMLQRFLKIRSVIERMREKDIEDLLLKINELENICIPCTNLYKMYVFSCFCCYNLCYYRLSPIDQVTVGLQGRTISVYQAQQLVNFVTQVHSDQLDLNNEYLNVGCNILRSKSFFTGVMKVYEGRENQLSFLEKNALRAFKKPIQQASMKTNWKSIRIRLILWLILLQKQTHHWGSTEQFLMSHHITIWILYRELLVKSKDCSVYLGISSLTIARR